MKALWILRRYVSAEYLRWFFFCLAGFVGIAVIVDLFEKANTFLKGHASLDLVARYTLYQLPEFITYMIAPATLMAILIALSGMTRRNEVTAILAGGVGRRTVVAPMAILALLMCVAQFSLSEYVVPEANAQKRFIVDVLIKGKSYAKFSDRRNRWFYADGGFLRVEAIDQKDKTLHGVLLLQPAKDGPPARIEGRAAQWNPQSKKWDLIDTRMATVGSNGMLMVTRSDAAILPVSLQPSDLADKVSRTEEWGVRDLEKIIHDRKRLGQDTVKEQVDLEGRFAIPLAGFVMGLLGAPFAFREHRRGGAAAGLVTGIVIAFGYFIVLSIGMALGKGGALPPVAAVWLPNAIFGGTGLYLSATLDRL